jgi:trimethylamine monooxygenase
VVFAGKDLLIIGGSYSAEDIGIQCYKYGAKSVTFSYRTKPMGFNWPENFTERPLLTKVVGKTAHFKDGSTKEVDAIVLCTGFLHHYPYLPDELRLKSNNRLFPLGLYKGIFWQDCPRFMYLGAQDQYYTFTMFDAQAWYARAVVLGRSALPDFAAREADLLRWRAQEEEVADAFEAIDYQTEYTRDLLQATDYPPLDVDRVAELFKEWEHHKVEGILTYRDRAYPSVITGTMSPAHHTKWIEALDDSLVTFLNTGKSA